MSLIGKKAPEFTADAVIDGQVKQFDSKSLEGKWSVVFFYPLDFTFVCPTEVLAFDERLQDFKEIGAEVVGVSVDSAFTHLAWINTPKDKGGLGGLDLPLVADVNKEISRGFDVLEEEAGVAFRGVFVIDPEGTVQSAIVNNLPVGRNVSEVLRTLKAFQYVTSHEGEVCPADWEEGAETMKATPEGVAEYLGKHG
ncbi:MAG: peroxiredoxin [Myxococcota bacterium]